MFTYSMIFKSFNSDINKATSKIGMFNKSFWAMKQDMSTGHSKLYSIFGGQGYAKGDSQAVLNLNKAIEEGTDLDIAWAQSMSNASVACQEVTSKTIKANGSLTDLASGMKKVEGGSIAAAIGFKALSVAANIALSIGIGLLISAITDGIQKLTHAQEDAIQKADELIEKFKEEREALVSNEKTIESISSDYEKLAKGVDSQGKNISLSTEEYEKYNDIVNQIANMFPTMVQGYTDEGNAIIKHKGYVEALTHAYREQKDAAQDAMITGSADVYKGFKAKVDKNASWIWEETGLLQMQSVLQYYLEHWREEGVSRPNVHQKEIDDALKYIGVAGVNKTSFVLGKNGFLSFIYFTMISNTLAMLSAAFTIPFAVDGIRKKRFTLPRWISLMHYSATISVTIMLFCVIFFISWVSPDDAFGGANLVTHIFCPVLILISFFQTENGYIYTMKNQSLGMIPLCLYIIAYFFEVILIGEVNGGWPDIYRVKEFLPYWLAIPILFLFGLCISFLIRMISNRLTNIRRAKMFALLKEDANPEEVFREAYGIGVMIGLKGEKNSIRIPYDILEYFAEKYRLNVDDLTKFFVDGIMDGLKDRNKDNIEDRVQSEKSRLSE